MNVSWEVYPLPTATLLPMFEVSVDAQKTLHSPSGQWTLTTRDNRLIVNEDGRETIFDLLSLLRDQPEGGRRDIVEIKSESGQKGTLVLQAFDISTGEGGPALTRIRGSIILHNQPAGNSR